MNLLFYIAAFFVLSIGSTELLVTAVNRLHSLPLRSFYLRQVRHLHDLLIPIFPLWLLIGLGLIAPGLLINPIDPADAWSLLPWPARFYLVVCASGFVGFVWAVIRHQLRRVPSQQRSSTSRVIDILQELGQAPLGPGPFGFMTRIPGNQCFELELSERVLEFERLPKELDGVRILHLTDLHFIGTIDYAYYARLFEHVSHLKYDLAVFTGDLLDNMQLVPWIPKTLGTIRARAGNYAILGNHDWNLPSDEIRKTLTDAGWVDVASRCETVTINGVDIVICGNERPWMGVAPSLADQPASRFRIALSHSPDTKEWACAEKIDLMLSGHNHGGQVVLPVIGPVYSPSVYGCKYAGGLYWLNPTLLCVSRGVSGRHPLRIGARPEVGILELRAKK